MRSLTRIFKKFAGMRRYLLLAAVCTAASCIAELIMPRQMADIINSGVLTEDMAFIRRQGMLMMVCVLVLSVAGYSSYYMGNAAGQKLALKLRGELYGKIYSLSYAQIEKIGEGALVTRLSNDIDICAQMASSMIELIVEPVLLLIGGIYMIWQVFPAFAFVFLGFSFLQIAIMVAFIAKSAPRFRQVQGLTDRMNSYLERVLSGFKFVKIGTGEDSEKKRFGRHNRELCAADLRAQRLLAWFNPVVMMVMNASVFAVLLASGFAVENQSLPVGNVVAVITWSEQILLSIVVSGGLFRSAAQTIPSAERLLEVLDTEPEQKSGEQPLDGPVLQVTLKDVGFSWPDSGKILSNCSCQFAGAGIMVITGAVGSGKSTLAKLLVRLYDCGEGAILVNGRDSREYDITSLRRKITLLAKDDAVLSDSFRENIRFGRDNIGEEEILRAAHTAHCADYIEMLPDSYDTHVNFRGTVISGGERQRLLLARALAGQPDVLVMDDALSALDYLTEDDVIKDMRTQYPAMMILLFTQSTHSRRYADRTFQLREGGLWD